MQRSIILLSVLLGLFFGPGAAPAPAQSTPEQCLILATTSVTTLRDHAFFLACGDAEMTVFPISTPGAEARQYTVAPHGEQIFYVERRYEDAPGDKVHISDVLIQVTLPERSQHTIYTFDQVYRPDEQWLTLEGWSPDGSTLVFSTPDMIYAFYPGLNAITPWDGALDSLMWDTSPAPPDDLRGSRIAWSLDGDWIAYEAPHPQDPTDIDPLYQIFKRRADGSDVHQLTDLEHGAFSPAWSPDGDWIAFADGNNIDTVGYGLSRIRPDGSGYAQITERLNDGYPQWSPDGQWISFISMKRPLSALNHCYRVRPDGTDLQQIGEIGMGNSDAVSCGPWIVPNDANR